MRKGQIILCVALLAMVHSFHSDPSLGETFGLSLDARQMLASLLIGGAGGIALGGFSRVSQDMGTFPSRIGESVFAASAIGASEELLFRGYIQGRLHRLGPVPAVVIAAAAHSAYKEEI
jgi:membrane protease YdiL (CAAX protease family)